MFSHFLYRSSQVQYIRQRMNKQNSNQRMASPFSHTLPLKAPQSAMKSGLSNKTQRKSSLNNRTVLGEMTNQSIQFNTNIKSQGNAMSKQISTEMAKNHNSKVSSHASRWLDSEKEMMEFILNLKNKKSEPKATHIKKSTEFEFEQTKTDQKQLFCNKMILMKKIERYEKQAISAFYDKNYPRCFGELNKAENLIKKQQINTPQHQLYINYLYAQFYYKLEEFDKWKIYLQRAKNNISKVDNAQNGKMKEYVMNLKALDICRAVYEERYDRTLEMVDQLRNQQFLSSKIRRRIATAQITALKKLHRFRDAVESIDAESRALQHDSELSQDKKESEFARLFEEKINITVQHSSTEKAIQMVEYLLSFDSVANGKRQQLSYYNSRIYTIYAELLKKQGDRLKLLYFYELWLETQPSKKQKLKIYLELFSIYYQMGIYQKALQLFDEISSENVVYLGPQYLVMFANIKHFQGQEKEAISIISKSIEMCQEETVRAECMYRLLELDLEEESYGLREERQAKLEECLRNSQREKVDHVSQLYLEYLCARGQTQKYHAFNHSWKQTAFFKQHTKSNRKQSRTKVN